MRVITGTSKGKKLRTLPGRSVRPTSDRVKGSIFNTLGDEIKGQIVLDLFAGTGNLGIEALSRGAAKVVFVEKGKQSSRLIQENLSRCQVERRSEILPKDAVRAIGFLEQRHDLFDLILMDPPYRKGWISRILAALMSQPIYHDRSILVLEHDRREPLPDILGPWELIRQRRMGDTLVSFLLLHGAPRAKPVVPPSKYPPTPLGTEAPRGANAKASEGYPPVAKSAEAGIPRFKISTDTAHAFIHGQSPCLHAEVRFGTQAWSSA